MKITRRSILTYFFLGLLLIGTSCTQKQRILNDNFSENILLNQMGYKTNAAKKVLIATDVIAFELVDKKGKVVFEGTTGELKYWELSGNSVREADFSSFSKQGEYRICINENEFSSVFVINENPYKGLADAALKSYYYARCGADIEEQFGGKWNWKAGHPDTEVMIHASAAGKNRPEGTIISSPGGWYDAGDYGKYTVNSGITTWTILQSLALNSDYHENQNLNIPESGNELPDILDEALVNLKWMMTMQDPNDGGLYHKLTTKKFDSFIMPHETSKQRYVLQKSTSAALDYAATIAAASRAYQVYNMTDLAEQMKQRAKAAWQWALENPDVFYLQPEDISTGAYRDTSFIDEWFWAASEMYQITGDKKCLEIIKSNYQNPITPKWNVVNTLGIISLLTSDKRSEFEAIERDYIKYVDELVKTDKASAYLTSLEKFVWGSNSDIANHGMLKLIAYQLTQDVKYFNSARNDLDYLLGRNATGYSFVTGFGNKTPMKVHQRISATDGIEEPVPGYLAGGPNVIVLNDCDPEKVERSLFPAKSYTDTECSFSTNETAINWNAPLVFLVSGIESIDK